MVTFSSLFSSKFQYALYLVYLGLVVFASAWIGMLLPLTFEITLFCRLLWFPFLVIGRVLAAYNDILFSGVAFWMQTGERQTARLRLKYLQSVLKKDISFFDTEARDKNLIYHISSDAILVQDAIGDKV